jgi:hypothetical protein
MVLQVATQAQTEQMRQEEQRSATDRFMMDRAEDQLASYVRGCWATAKSFRRSSGLHNRLGECLRRKKGEYSAEKIAAIKQQGGSDIYMMLTAAKCRAAKAWLSDLFSPAGDRPWDLEPTPIPDLPPEIAEQMIQEAMAVIQQSDIPMEQVQALLQKHKDRLLNELKDEAKDRADRMADVIEDMLCEAGFRNVFDDFLDDFCTYPYGVIKGLEFRRSKKLVWAANQQTGQYQPVTQPFVERRIRRVSPWRFYRSPAATESLEGHWSIEHVTYTRKDLTSMRNMEAAGYHSENLAIVLSDYARNGLTEWLWNDDEKNILNGYALGGNSETIDALVWEGSIQGQRLLDWGMGPELVQDALGEYQVSIEVVGSYVIRAMISADPAGKSDYFIAAWQSVPGSMEGVALPEAMADCQDQCNAAARSLVNNMSLSSGPQVWVDMDMMDAGAETNEVWPWKIWHGSSKNQQGSRAAIEFFQPNSNANELMAIYERFAKYADDITGLPAYAYGSDQGAGAAKTASGYSMMVNAASKVIKLAVRTIDIDVLEKLVQKAFNHVMLTHPDQSIKGDAVPKARGSDQLVQKEAQAMRLQELLGQTANPIDMQIIGPEGRREQLEQVYKAVDADFSDIVPTRDELKERMAAQAAQPQPPQARENANAPA